MLTVPVNLDVNIITKPPSILMPRLNCPTDTQILRQVEYIYAIFFTNLKGVICRPVINDNIIVTTINDRLNGCNNIIFLVICGNYHQHARFRNHHYP